MNYTYNANGDLTGDGFTQYHYNPEGRLSSMATGNTDTSPTTRYAHNALGQRVFKTEPLYENIPEQPGEQGFWASLMAFFGQFWSPQATPAEQLGWAYVYDEGGTLLGEYGTGGAQSTGSTQHIWLPTAGGPVPIAAVINGNTYAVHSDHLNTPRRLTNPQGQVAWQWKYSAFGDEQPTKAVNRFVDPVTMPGAGTGTVADVNYNLRYPGQYADSESGLHYNYFRSYDARTGRYTQPDPIGLNGGWNRFGYVEANALSNTDPLGLYLCGPGQRAISVAHRIWKCVPDGSDPNERQCATGECAAGVLPTPKPNPSSCEMQCGAGSEDWSWRGGMCAAISQLGSLFGAPGLPVNLACKWLDKQACIKKCEEDRRGKSCNP